MAPFSTVGASSKPGAIQVGCVVQSRAVAHRVDAEALDAALARSRHLKCLLLAYVGFCMNQITLAVACAPRYTTVQRLARWLLASCKLMDADTLSSTQYALATMLGVSRGQLNRAASELQRRGVVQVGRGGLTVLNATGLREIACSCDTGAQAMTR
ncbi:Crp/Fnr family transcriptional regulator [Paucibacter sp. XJ19-41]|uniref:Crp/Fnr family transcriptional regulator n=1 Tax=Paucibacter sp. XJ19-41 TaxID=2927824 RepID=UPI003FA7C0C4